MNCCRRRRHYHHAHALGHCCPAQEQASLSRQESAAVDLRSAPIARLPPSGEQHARPRHTPATSCLAACSATRRPAERGYIAPDDAARCLSRKHIAKNDAVVHEKHAS